MTVRIISHHAVRERERKRRKNVISSGDQILLADHYRCLKKESVVSLDRKAEKYVFFSRLGSRRSTSE